MATTEKKAAPSSAGDDLARLYPANSLKNQVRDPEGDVERIYGAQGDLFHPEIGLSTSNSEKRPCQLQGLFLWRMLVPAHGICGPWKMNGLFTKLENPEFFRAYVTAHFKSAPEEAIADFPCDHTIDVERVDVAHGDYKQKITEYSVLLHSANPDHYKRSGAMLHALCKSKIVTAVDFRASKWGSMEDLEFVMALGVSFEHAQQMLKFPEFYKRFITSFCPSI